MRLNTKFRYGSRAVLEIARNASAGPVKRKEIVRNQGIPDSYLENILIDLKKGD
jgi:DNA-binding IscR family transcriptional regulator